MTIEEMIIVAPSSDVLFGIVLNMVTSAINEKIIPEKV